MSEDSKELDLALRALEEAARQHTRRTNTHFVSTNLRLALSQVNQATRGAVVVATRDFTGPEAWR